MYIRKDMELRYTEGCTEEKMEAEDEGRERLTASFCAKAGEPWRSRKSSCSDGLSSNDVHRPSGLDARGRATIVDGAGQREADCVKKRKRDGVGSASASCQKKDPRTGSSRNALAKKKQARDHRVSAWNSSWIRQLDGQGLGIERRSIRKMSSAASSSHIGARSLDCSSGHVLDLTKEYNLNKKLHREKARRALEKDEPRLLVGSPPSTPCSNLWRLFGTPWDPADEQHVRLCLMYKYQMQTGTVLTS